MKNMKWNKKGLIFSVNNNSSWMSSHSALPIADHIENDLYRIYFSTRNKENISSIGFIEIDIKDPSTILNISKNPILSPGKLGTFDEFGVMASSLVNFDNKKYLYYIGWNIPKNLPFRWSIGLAISNDFGTSFQRFSEGPILDRNINDPYFVSSPTVVLDDGLWKMWYISALKWKKSKNQFIAPYNIRYAESKNGIDWNRTGKICVDFKDENEFAIGRASILQKNGIFHMWYSFSSGDYRIGYAYSDDGINWIRNDENAGITISYSGWDSESIEHSYVFKHKSDVYMLYSGNQFGKTGFGLAILETN